jgi:carbamoyltransferase
VNILGIHFGHDASVCLLRDGVVVAFLEKERLNRVKHAVTVDADDVAEILKRGGIATQQVDFVTLTSTQGFEYVFLDPRRLSFEMATEEVVPSPLFQIFAENNVKPAFSKEYVKSLFDSGEYARMAEGSIKPSRHDWVANGLKPYWGVPPEQVKTHPTVDYYLAPEGWGEGQYLSDGNLDLTRLVNKNFANAFHLPVMVNLEGRRIPGAMFAHHHAHAAYAYYSSPVQNALVFSQDGGIPDAVPYNSGMVYFGSGDGLFPLFPHWLNSGYLYAQLSTVLGFDMMSGPGKMMGLSSYGQPVFYSPVFADNLIGQRMRTGLTKTKEIVTQFSLWMRSVAETRGMDLSCLGDTSRILEPAATALAASLQKIFEDSMLRSVGTALSILASNGALPRSLVIAGGGALNCPANALLSRQLGFDTVEVPPGAIDSGLSIGSAMALYHGVLGHGRVPASTAAGMSYLGRQFTQDEVMSALSGRSGDVRWTDLGDRAAAVAAEALANDKVVGWFEGGSEIGPRALGHRSILADCRVAGNWKRVNKIKRREEWRPFAPIVLADRARDYFFGAPESSPYMLFTHYVASNGLPAITHVDHTARVQTVEPDAGGIFAVLARFHELTGMPVLMNTSFNGPGEPIVESPQDAIAAFLELGLDLLVLDGFVVERL